MKQRFLILWLGFAKNIRGILAELSDQNAYHRYLTAHGQSASPEAWRNFQDEHWQAKSRRGRCC